MKQQVRKHNQRILSLYFFVICVFFLTLLFYGSSLPYVGYNAWNYNIYSLIAHNYNLFGYFPTKFAQIVSVASSLPASPQYYLNHPPLLTLLTSVVFRLLGESFVTGRLVNISASFFIAVLLYAIGKQVLDKRFGLIVFVLSVVIPAATIFGKMIGQESLLLFFAVLSVFVTISFEDSGKKRWLILLVLSGILGTLTDWAMIYFALSLVIYLLYRRKKRVAILFVAVTAFTALCYVFYVSLLSGGLAILYNGFLNRSPGQLLRHNEWGILWGSTILIRLLFYFNPVIIALTVYYFLKRKKIGNNRIFLLVISFGLFGFTHVLLYPEGSFGHPYWMYYLLPAVALSSGASLQFIFSKRLGVLVWIIAYCVLYTVLLTYWKQKETAGNIFRYELAKIASKQFTPYGTLFVNREGVIDQDIFWYSFHHPTTMLEKNQTPDIDMQFSGVVFSCLSACSRNDTRLSLYKKRYFGTQFVGNGVEMWTFNGVGVQRRRTLRVKISVATPETSHSLFSFFYSKLQQFTSSPQL